VVSILPIVFTAVTLLGAIIWLFKVK
jgi:hypothetical protein